MSNHGNVMEIERAQDRHNIDIHILILKNKKRQTNCVWF